MQQNSPDVKSPQIAAEELDISKSTLRRWSEEFTDYLSVGASAKGRGKRCYADSDLETLSLIKELLNNSMTYEQVRNQLNGYHTKPADEPASIEQPTDDDLNDEQFEEESQPLTTDTEEDEIPGALVASKGDDSAAVSFMTNTLSALSDSQKSILNSQAANRELLGVLLQDNFNLKEENSRLRERILEVERDVAQNRQEEEWRREALRQELEAKISASSQIATEAIALVKSVETPEIKAVESNPGCLGMILGRGGTRIITTPKRRKAENPSSGPAHQPPAAANQQYPALPSQQQTSQGQGQHPKPMFPPE